MTIPGVDPAGEAPGRSDTLTDALAGEIKVPGKPMTWARARTSRHGPTYMPAERVQRMGDFAQRWIDTDQPRFGKGTFVSVEFEFVFPRPDSHYGTGRNAGILKNSAPKYPGSGQYGGDLGNLIKLVEDALNKVAYHDDSQIAMYDPAPLKRFIGPDEYPYTRVRIRPL